MTAALLVVILVGVAVTAVLVVVLLSRGTGTVQQMGQIGQIGTEVREELRSGREEAQKAGRELREEISTGLSSTGATLGKTLESLGNAQQAQIVTLTAQLKGLTDSNQKALDGVRATLDARVKELLDHNERKLEEMRKTVDEQLQTTLERRLGESFKLVGDRLEAVHKGLGEMHNLASDLGDFKRVLTNVKTRGTWAEVQLGAILDQTLTPEQYGKNVQVKTGSGEVVEYAVRLPGPRDDPGACVWLPIDSKFPQEDYLRLQTAADKADPEAVALATDALARTARELAREIHDKYVDPPGTTDFAIMFLATEGLYAEVIRQPGLAEQLQQKYRVVVAGPTTLAAVLNSLRLGFQTLAIERRATEVWRVLAAVKTEFQKFGGVLDKVKRQLETASRTIEETGKRSRVMERKLRSVEQLPRGEAAAILSLPEIREDAEAGEPAADTEPDPRPAPDVEGESGPSRN